MPIDNHTRQEAAEWFAALRRGPMSLAEREEFDNWRSDAVNQAALNSMHELWGEVAGIAQYDVGLLRRRRIRRKAAVAAAIAAVLVPIGIFLSLPASTPAAQHQFATAVGEQRQTTMPDGTIVNMNVATDLFYDVTDRKRAVRLDKGEAAFFVHKDKSRPFVVTAGNYEVTAVGTAFNVRNRGGKVEVSVIEGVVSLRAIAGPHAGEEFARLIAGKGVELGPVEQLDSKPVRIEPIAPQSAAEWRVRTLTYEDTPLSQVAAEFNLYFRRPLEIPQPELAGRRVTLRLQFDDREQALSTLAGLLGVRVERGTDSDQLAD